MTQTAWRDELSDRLNRYRARRKAPPPRYPSLRLPFETTGVEATGNPAGESFRPATFEPRSNHALALDGMTQKPSSAAEADVQYARCPRGRRALRSCSSRTIRT